MGYILDENYKTSKEPTLNPRYFIEKYFKITDIIKGGADKSFNLFPHQLRLIDSFENNNKVIVKTARQMGNTSLILAYLAVKAAITKKEESEEIIILTNSYNTSKHYLKLIKSFLMMLPQQVLLNPNISDENYIKYGNGNAKFNTVLLLNNGSKIIIDQLNLGSLRGYTPTRIFMDNAAYINNIEFEDYLKTMLSIYGNTQIILNSTPNGIDNLFYPIYTNSEFHKINIGWYENPNFNQGLIWVKGNQRIVETEFTLESYISKIKEGFKPVNDWYLKTCRNFLKEEDILQELDAKFIEK